jgi:hypothetical protein
MENRKTPDNARTTKPVPLCKSELRKIARRLDRQGAVSKPNLNSLAVAVLRPPNLITLPNGACLKFAYPWTTGEMAKWFYTWETPVLLDQAAKPDKKDLPRFDLRSSRTSLNFIAADFDKEGVSERAFISK